MCFVLPRRSPSHAWRNASRPQKVHAWNFLAYPAVFAFPESPASQEGIRGNSFYAGNSRQGVTVDGNVRALVKTDAVNPAASDVVEQYAYDEVGREFPSSTPIANRLSSFAFSPKCLDAETGMNYYGCRYYLNVAAGELASAAYNVTRACK